MNFIVFFLTFWNAIQEFFLTLWEIGKGPFVGGALLLIAGFIFRKTVLKFFNNSFGFLSDFRNRRFQLPKSLLAYKKSLDETTLDLNHSWKLEGQTLRELLVPVNVERRGETQRISLEEYIKTVYSQSSNARFVLLGDAGSGKSVAMGVIARKMLELERETPLFPILLTFSDIKNVRTDSDFIKVMVQNLERHQFEEGKRNQRAENYVSSNLYNGNIIVLLDGFDELEKTNRSEIAKFLTHFFQTHQEIPFVISSRIAVWKRRPNLFPNLSFQIIEMADLTPYEIRMFVSQWKFQGNKSSEQLAYIINNKIYLRQVAVNPLMLTIITFLYAQPKRILPDNRVEFYKECIQALFEKFDNTRQLNRANQFETIDKISILSHLAYTHIVNAKTTDEEISKKTAIDIITKMMEKLSRPVNKREQMLVEIVENAGLLVELPPSDYKFPHRTFMEYFAANYFFEENRHKELLSLYQEDNGKWEETLCLFCGLNTNTDISDEILRQLEDNFINTVPEPNAFVFKALVESTRINPNVAKEVLSIADSYLSKTLNQDVLENLGYIAVNSNWEHAKQAENVLMKLLDKDLNDDDFQKVVMALVHIKNPKIQEVILRHSERINLTEFLTKLGRDVGDYARKLLESLPAVRYEEILEGIREADNLNLLFELMVSSNKEELQQHAAYQLCLSSKTEGFFKWIDEQSLENLRLETKEIVEKRYKDWKWTRPKPMTKTGQFAIFVMCYLAGEFAVERKFLNNRRKIHNWVAYLINDNTQRDSYNFLSELTEAKISVKASKLIWEREAFLNNVVFTFFVSTLNFVLIFIGAYYSFMPIVLYLIINLVGLIIVVSIFLYKNREVYFQDTTTIFDSLNYYSMMSLVLIQIGLPFALFFIVDIEYKDIKYVKYVDFGYVIVYMKNIIRYTKLVLFLVFFFSLTLSCFVVVYFPFYLCIAYLIVNLLYFYSVYSEYYQDKISSMFCRNEKLNIFLRNEKLFNFMQGE